MQTQRTWRLLVRKHHMAPYACLSEPKIYLWKEKKEIHMSIFSFIYQRRARTDVERKRLSIYTEYFPDVSY